MKIFTEMGIIKSILIMAFLLAAWILYTFIMPTEIVIWTNIIIASLAVGIFISKVPDMLSKRTDRDLLNNMYEIADGLHHLINEMFATLYQCRNAMAAQQAKIDELMFEYCPQKMTPEQIANYEARQKQSVDVGGIIKQFDLEKK